MITKDPKKRPQLRSSSEKPKTSSNGRSRVTNKRPYEMGGFIENYFGDLYPLMDLQKST